MSLWSVHFCCNLFLFLLFVQLLTMRNGVSLYPMCLPGILQSNEISHMRMGYSEGRSRSLNVNTMTRATTSLDPTTTPSNIMFTLPGHYPNQEQTSSIPNLRKLSDSDSFGLGSSTQVHSESFQLQIPGSSKVSSVWWINHSHCAKITQSKRFSMAVHLEYLHPRIYLLLSSSTTSKRIYPRWEFLLIYIYIYIRQMIDVYA